MRSQQTVAEFTEAVIDNTGIIAPIAVVVDSEEREFTDQRANIEKRCRKYIEAGLKLDPLSARTIQRLTKTAQRYLPRH